MNQIMTKKILLLVGALLLISSMAIATPIKLSGQYTFADLISLNGNGGVLLVISCFMISSIHRQGQAVLHPFQPTESR